VLIGSEAAQLASDQDARSWNRRLSRRRTDYIDPFILRPLVDRLIAAGILPVPKDPYRIEWPDLNTPGNLDKSTIAANRTNALAKYVQGGVDTIIPPFHYLTLILGMTDEEAKAIIDKAGGDQSMLEEISGVRQMDAGGPGGSVGGNGNTVAGTRPGIRPPAARATRAAP
jgi:hypothetical protein